MRLTIANWNLERVTPKQARAQRIREAIANIKADIWILTETHQAFAPASGFSSVTSDATEDRPSRPGECWSAIWTKLSISPLLEQVSDKQRCTAALIEHPQLGQIVVYALVLPWSGDCWRNIPYREGAFAAALATYQEDWQRLQQQYSKALHIIAGDFNQSLVDWHYYGSRENRARLEQALADCRITIATAGPLDPIARDSPPQACIDHICVSQSGANRLVRSHCWPNAPHPKRQLSDHYGVLIDLEVSKS